MNNILAREKRGNRRKAVKISGSVKGGSTRDRTLATIRSKSAKLVLRELLERELCSRAEIAQLTGLTDTVVSRVVQRLITEGVIVEGGQSPNQTGPGRPSIELKFNCGYFVTGIGIRGYTQWVELRGLGSKSIVSEHFVCDDLKDPIAVLRRCCDELDKLLRRRRVARDHILGVGVLIVGVVDFYTGTVLRAENLGWRRVEVRKILERLIDYPVIIEAMLNGMNLLQSLLNSKQSENSLLVSVALGIGASAIVDGRISRGSEFAAGQLGHLRTRCSEIKCVCGRFGCLDTVASGRAILKAHGLLGQKSRFVASTSSERFRNLSEAARSDPEIAKNLRMAGRELGRAIGAAITLLDPREIIFTGFVIDDDHYFDGVQDELAWYRVGTSAQRVDCLRHQQTGEGAPSMMAAIGLTSDE